MVEGKRSPEWAIDWFGGFAGPYLPRGGAVNPASLQRHTQHTQAGNSMGDEPRSPSGFFLHGSPMASIARVFNGVFGVGAPVWAYVIVGAGATSRVHKGGRRAVDAGEYILILVLRIGNYD